MVSANVRKVGGSGLSAFAPVTLGNNHSNGYLFSIMDAREFNIEDDQGRLLCPSCGFPGFSLEPAYDERGGLVGTALCPCCMWEPGFDDDTMASANARDTIQESLRSYRSKLGSPLEWQGLKNERPEGWNGERQLSTLFAIAPYVR